MNKNLFFSRLRSNSQKSSKFKKLQLSFYEHNLTKIFLYRKIENSELKSEICSLRLSISNDHLIPRELQFDSSLLSYQILLEYFKIFGRNERKSFVIEQYL